MNFKPIAFAVVALVLQGCVTEENVAKITEIPLSSRQVSTIQGVVKNKLRDPGSAQFRNIRQYEVVTAEGKTNRHVCGEVNGKNGFGGYVGFTPFRGNLYDGHSFKLFMISEYVRCPY